MIDIIFTNIKNNEEYFGLITIINCLDLTTVTLKKITIKNLNNNKKVLVDLIGKTGLSSKFRFLDCNINKNGKLIFEDKRDSYPQLSDEILKIADEVVNKNKSLFFPQKLV